MEQRGEASPCFASCVPGDVRIVGSDNPDTYPDDPAASRAAEAVAGSENRDFPTVLAGTAVAPSLALLDSVLVMAPGHQAALRCRATTLARLGRTSEALVAADLAVASAKAAVRATEVKGKDAEFRRTSASASKSASTTTAVDCHVTGTGSLPSFPPAAVAGGGGGYSGRVPHHGNNATISGALDSSGLGGFRISGDVGIGASSDHGRGCDAGAGNSCGDQRPPSSPNVSIGFMRSSKINVTVGGLLLTGGGRADTMDVAKSLILRGCLHQKMGRRKNAKEDYGQALVLCHKRLNDIDGLLESHHVEPDNKSQQLGRASSTSGQGHGTHLDGRSQEKDGANARKRAADIDHAHLSAHRTESADGDTTVEHFDVSPTAHSSGGVCTGIHGDGNPSWGHDGRCEVLKLQSLIHHNFATLHMTALLGADTRASFLRVSREVIGIP